MEVQVNVDFGDIAEKLKELGPKLERSALRKAVKASGDMWVEEMKSRVPVDTGDLRDSIKAKVRTRKLPGGGAEAKVSVGPAFGVTERKQGDGSQQPGVYGMFVEFGTSTAAPRPWMRPTFDATQERAVQILVDTLKENFDEIVKS